MSGGAQQIVFAGKLASLGVVDDQDVDVAQSFAELGVGALDPVVHGVQGDEFGLAFDLFKNVALQVGRDIGEEDVFGMTVFLGEFRFEVCENVEVGDQRGALVEILGIFTRPEKRFAGGAFEAFDVDGAAAENLRVDFSEIVADDSDQIDVREKAGGDGEVGGRTAQGAVYLSVRAFQSIECNTTDDEQGHAALLRDIFPDDGGKLLFCGFGDDFEIGDQGMRQRRAAFARAFGRQRFHRLAQDLLGIVRVLVECGDDLCGSNRFVLGVPAVVIGDHGDGGVAEFRFARELGFRDVGHADDLEAHRAVEVGFGESRELRTFHADVRSFTVDGHGAVYAGVRQNGGKFAASGMREGDVGYQTVAEESGNAALGAIEELVGNEEFAGAQIFVERADGAHGNDAFDAKNFHGVYVGAIIDFAGKQAMPASVAREERYALRFQRA